LFFLIGCERGRRSRFIAKRGSSALLKSRLTDFALGNKLMALGDEDLQPLWLEIGESVSSDSILAVEF